jgi:hypothetical protein
MSIPIPLLLKKGDQIKNAASKFIAPLPPTVNLGKPNSLSVNLEKNIVQNNAPPVGDQFIKPYNNFEKTIQGIENANDFITTLGFGSSVTNFAAPSSKFAKSISPLSKVGNKANQVQAGLWVIDAGRALVDPEYREKVQDGINQMFDDSQGNTDLMSTAFLYGSQRPIAFTAGLLRNAQNTRDEIKKLKSESKALSNQIEEKKLNMQSSITSKGARDIGNTGMDFKDFMDTRRDQGIILDQAQNYKSQIK